METLLIADICRIFRISATYKRSAVYFGARRVLKISKRTLRWRIAVPKRAKVCDIVVKEDLEGGGHGGQIIPGESAIGTGVLRQADVQRLSLNRT